LTIGLLLSCSALNYARRAFPDFWSLFFKFENVFGLALFGDTAFFDRSVDIYLGFVVPPST